MPDKFDLLRYLQAECRDRERSRTVREISQWMEVSERIIRDWVGELVSEGYPIVTSTEPPAGVCFTEDPEELDHNIRSLPSRMEEIGGRVAALKRTRQRIFRCPGEQLRLF